MDHYGKSLQIFYPTQNPHIWPATTENHYQASGIHRDHYFSYTPLPESTHLDCYYSESLPSFRNAPRSLHVLFVHPRLKIRAPTKIDMNSLLLRHPRLKISTNRGHRRKKVRSAPRNFGDENRYTAQGHYTRSAPNEI